MALGTALTISGTSALLSQGISLLRATPATISASATGHTAVTATAPTGQALYRAAPNSGKPDRMQDANAIFGSEQKIKRGA